MPMEDSIADLRRLETIVTDRKVQKKIILLTMGSTRGEFEKPNGSGKMV